MRRNGEEKSYRLAQRELGKWLQLGTTVACMSGIQFLIMKTNLFIFSLASLTLAVVGAKASTLNESEVTILPTYRFETARYTPAERSIETSLAELRASAKTPVTRIVAPLVAEQADANKAALTAEIAKNSKATRLAKN
jgi:hypothetical protein